jgi:hypothetical protein
VIFGRRAMAVALALLDGAPGQRIEQLTLDWTDGRYRDLERLLVAHGLNPWLWQEVGGERLSRVLPAPTVQRIASQHRANAERIDALHHDLARILRAATAAGIEAMPLKGALLTTRNDEQRHRRPMADLDLLVRPADRHAMDQLLVRLGYRHQPENNPRPTHETYLNPGAAGVVTDGEHADNPRRVEVHTEVMRHLWGWIDDDEVTPALWRRAATGTVVGERALIPADADLVAHLAVHASSDLLVGRGRLVQWLDFGALSETLGAVLSGLPHPALAFPSIGLAYRALPQLSDIDPRVIYGQVPRRLVRWVEGVPLDDRSGLAMPGPLPLPSSWRARWQRWAPYRWRMAVAYGDVALPVGLARHAQMLAGHVRRASRS